MPNIAPSGQDNSLAGYENNAIPLTTADFGFSDTEGNNFAGIVVSTTPSGGRLMLNGAQVNSGQFITATDIAAGLLEYEPFAEGSGAPYDSFTFQVRDDGGTAGGGFDTDASPNTITFNVTSVDPPVIANIGPENPAPVYEEDGPPILIDLGSDATVTDSDSANFDGGFLRLEMTSFPDNGLDDFGIAEGSVITVTSQGVGGLVQFQGVTIGTITTDQDELFQITFTNETTPARVQQLVRQLSYQVSGVELGLNPNDRTIALTINDGDTGETTVSNIDVYVQGLEDRQQISGLDPVVLFPPTAVTSAPQIIDPSVEYSDVDSYAGDLTLRIDGVLAEDVVGIRNEGNGPGQVGVVGSSIRYEGVTVGSFTGGNGIPLIITFNNGSPVPIDAVVQNLTYFNTSGTPTASRILTFTFYTSEPFEPRLLTSQPVELRIAPVITGTGGDDTMNGTGAAETFQGGVGNDTMAGAGGDDNYHVDSASDVVTEASGAGRDAVVATVSYTLAEGSEVEVLWGAGNGPLTLNGNSGANTIYGTPGGDTLGGGGGNDTLWGFAGEDTMTGGEGDDELLGGVGNDNMAGGPGNDTYHADDAGDVVLEAVGEGIDRVLAATDFTLTAGAEIEILESESWHNATPYGSRGLHLTGNEFGQTITGTVRLDVLRGGGGNDTIVGNGSRGFGAADTLYGDGGNDTLLGGVGRDYLYGGSGNDYLDGGSSTSEYNLGNRLYGEEGDDTLVGGGSDMYGGTGNDTYYVKTAGYFGGPFSQSSPPDRIFENADEGYDLVYTTINFTLPDNVEALVVGSTSSGLTLTGNGGANRLVGGSGADTLTGNAGDDVLDGGAGADTMTGGEGSDTFYVDNAGDVVIDPVAAGVDRVATSVSYNLPGAADIEVFEFVDSTSTAALNLGGNNFGQTMVGNAGNNVVNGGGGDDTLVGLAGDDTLIGSPGNDTMYGGTGNDVYFVDAAGDQVFEFAGEGTDRVAAAISYTLAVNASVETFETTDLSGTGALDLTGSTGNQYIIGNNGNNVLQGGGGNDWMIGAGGDDTFVGTSSAGLLEGGAGNDLYFIVDSSDLIVELSGGGNDRAAVNTSYTLGADAEVETLETFSLAGTSAFALTGNAFAQLIVGNAGANWLDGRGGADTLVGAGGADTFAFTSALGGSNVDTIEGFEAGTDRIALDDAILADLNPGSMDPNRFVIGSAAQDADDRVVYDPATGALWFDADGNGDGAAVQIATLAGAPSLSAADFIVI